jgi:hypothetical protein
VVGRASYADGGHFVACGCAFYPGFAVGLPLGRRIIFRRPAGGPGEAITRHEVAAPRVAGPRGSVRFYSVRKASIGSMAAAWRQGMKVAAAAAVKKISITAAIRPGSVGAVL